MTGIPLCDRTVTLYRSDGTRQVVENCCYRYRDVQGADNFFREFLLIAPVELRPGDRIFDGIGPEQVDWETFLPVSVPGLSQAEYARYWDFPGLSHWEAGR